MTGDRARNREGDWPLGEHDAHTSAEVLDRVMRDSETLISSSIRRIADHLDGRDALGIGEDGGTDPVELWGRRIGRSLSVLGFVALSLWLAVQLGWI